MMDMGGMGVRGRMAGTKAKANGFRRRRLLLGIGFGCPFVVVVVDVFAVGVVL